MKSLIRNKQQKKTKQLLQKKTNASRNRVHKKTNIFNRNKNIYYAHKKVVVLKPQRIILLQIILKQ